MSDSSENKVSRLTLGTSRALALWTCACTVLGRLADASRPAGDVQLSHVFEPWCAATDAPGADPLRDIDLAKRADPTESPSSSSPATVTVSVPGTASASATAITTNSPLRYVLNPTETHTYMMTAAPTESVYIDLSVCNEPYESSEFDLDPADASLLLRAGRGSGSGGSETMLQTGTSLGYAGMLVPEGSDTVLTIEISRNSSAIDASSLSGNWTYQLGVGTNGYTSSYSDMPDLYLVDTDFAHALFVTANYTQFNLSTTRIGRLNVSEFGLYVYPVSDAVSVDVKLPHSYCALSTGPAILNVDNTDRSETKRGYGDMVKGQFLLNGLNTSTEYKAYLTLPHTNSTSSGIIYGAVDFTSKADEICQLAYDLEFCSDVAYAVPGNASAFEIDTLRQFYDEMARDRYKNFTLSLQQISCNASEINRYSLMQSCDDCAESYKQWMCAVTIPRCADWSNNASYLFPRPIGKSRNPVIDEVIQPGRYKEILPCADLCYRIAQDCSAQFGFYCPKGELLKQSYGDYSDDGDVTCSYPGAVYFLARASSVIPTMPMYFVVVLSFLLFIY